MAQLSFLLLLATVTAVLAAPQFDKYTLKFEDGVSQASVGFFIHPLSTTFTNNQYAEWIMDFENEKLRFSIGNSNQANYLQLFAFEDKSYILEVNASNSNALFCFSVPVTFRNVMGAYLYPHVRYIGDTVINGQTFRMYAGVSPDPITNSHIANLAYVSESTTAFAQMPIIAPDGFIYYAFPNVTIGNPPASYYTVPSICNVATPTCTPACGDNAHCVNQMCVCYKGFNGNPTTGCVANVSLPQGLGSMNITFDKHLLQIGGDAVSQTCIGSYTNPITNVSVYSAWVQHLESKTIRWDVGSPGESGSVSYYFMSDVTYTVTYKSSSTVICNTASQMNYTQAFNNMFYPTMRYLGETNYNNVPCRMYAGTGVPNPNTAATSMIKFISASDSKFYLLAMLNTQGYTYYDYPNVTLGVPSSSWFSLPSVCSRGNAVVPFSPIGLAFFAGVALMFLRSLKLC